MYRITFYTKLKHPLQNNFNWFPIKNSAQSHTSDLNQRWKGLRRCGRVSLSHGGLRGLVRLVHGCEVLSDALVHVQVLCHAPVDANRLALAQRSFLVAGVDALFVAAGGHSVFVYVCLKLRLKRKMIITNLRFLTVLCIC